MQKTGSPCQHVKDCDSNRTVRIIWAAIRSLMQYGNSTTVALTLGRRNIMSHKTLRQGAPDMRNHTQTQTLHHIARKLAAEVTYIMVVKMNIMDENDPWWNTVNRLSKAFEYLQSNKTSHAEQMIREAMQHIPGEESTLVSQRLAAIRQAIIRATS